MSENPFLEIKDEIDSLKKIIVDFMEVQKEKHVSIEKPLTVKEAAEITGLSEAFIRQMNASPEKYKDCIPFRKVMGRVYFFPSELDQWMRGGNIKGKQN